ncbi:MAG: hypothetical protein LBU91_03245 [Bacteroidales bacterium]|jgi:hypothetical protein|nr:hypothetical protein [Bacteroidales bacterium]
MYLSGHLLASIALAKVIHKPLGISFFSLAIAAMAVNLIDADHLIYYYRDAGTGNSFQLHPLHQFWSFLGLIVCLLALVLKPYKNLILGILGTLMLHYGLDAVGNLVDYQLVYVLGFEVLCLVGLCVLFRKDNQFKRYVLFFGGVWLACNGVLGFESYYLYWQPHLNRGIYLTSVILNLLAIAVFWQLFVGAKHISSLQKRKKITTKNGR